MEAILNSGIKATNKWKLDHFYEQWKTHHAIKWSSFHYVWNWVSSSLGASGYFTTLFDWKKCWRKGFTCFGIEQQIQCWNNQTKCQIDSGWRAGSKGIDVKSNFPFSSKLQERQRHKVIILSFFFFCHLSCLFVCFWL